jgi:D-alanyl-D-alanine dipeptidase
MFSIGVSYCQNNVKPDSFKEIQKEIPSIELDIRYFGNHNFIGIPIEGYLQPIALLTKEALEKLKNVQKQLELQNLGLKIFDGYRPQRAVNHFVRWAKNEKDTLMKAEFYPAVAKKDLFRLDYIAAKSGHSRGSTVDLTIINLDSRIPLDMGSPYDYFDTISWPFEKSITPKQQSNRLLLRKVMVENNFKPYQSEWWHFTLKNEPYPITYFDFLVE